MRLYLQTVVKKQAFFVALILLSVRQCSLFVVKKVSCSGRLIVLFRLVC